MPNDNPIGEYLRARRELTLPDDVPLLAAAHERRRVPGLRREEVALLAGVSIDYYVRLEQGRDRHPSSQVLDALGRALGLDEDATAHLHRLAAAPARKRRESARPESVRPEILQLLAGWDRTPAYVHDRYMDVLASNPLVAAIFPWLVEGENVVRSAFLDPRFADFLGRREEVTEAAAAMLRALVGPDVDDPRLNELVGELSVRSERFRQLWPRHDVQPKRVGVAYVDHPQVGYLELSYEKLTIPQSDCQTLTIYHAAPDSPTARSLLLLATAMAIEREPAPLD
jgi:transcriptional regulator with XRE-family HTH domain